MYPALRFTSLPPIISSGKQIMPNAKSYCQPPSFVARAPLNTNLSYILSYSAYLMFLYKLYAITRVTRDHISTIYYTSKFLNNNAAGHRDFTGCRHYLDTAVLKKKTIEFSLCQIRYLLPDYLSILKERLILPRLCFLVASGVK